MSKNVFNQQYVVSREGREGLLKQHSVMLWFTGLSGSGKSTIANAVEQALHHDSFHTYSLDGDNIRLGINKNLGFTPEDRKENLRRIAHIGKLFVDAGTIVLGAFVSPYEKDRATVKSIVGTQNFVEIYIDTPVEECERRDVKGLYAKARAGEITNFTGISAPYEAPSNPDIHIKTVDVTIQDAVETVLQVIEHKIN